GPYLIGTPDTVAAKLRFVHGALGGVDRLSFQMTNVLMPHARMLRSVELLGREVAPQVADL
ncbi:LLM class flavin-dependent oxidoreductase, partial [Deinococcus sp. 12RED42]|nr:LLM class flavin-dependent oxidoreductase [Deinococcus sp. 12RED42]